MKGRLSLSPLGIATLVVFVVGVVLLFVASGGLQVAGLVVAIIAFGFIAAAGLTPAFTALGRTSMRGDPAPGAFDGPPDPPPETVASNPEPTEADWARERAHADAKRRAERSEG